MDIENIDVSKTENKVLVEKVVRRYGNTIFEIGGYRCTNIDKNTTASDKIIKILASEINYNIKLKGLSAPLTLYYS